MTLSKSDIETEDILFHAIPDRQSTRRKYDGRPIPADDLDKLKSASEQDCVSFRLFADEADIEPLIEFVGEANRAQFSDRAFVDELVSWIRFNRSEAEKYKDGLTSITMGFPNVPSWLGSFIIKRLDSPASEAKRTEKAIRSSSALMLFIAESNDKRCWVNLGRSFERVALMATTLGIRHAHVNMPCEVLEVRAKLKRHLELKNAEPLLLLRIGYAEPMPRSIRRPVEEVMR